MAFSDFLLPMMALGFITGISLAVSLHLWQRIRRNERDHSRTLHRVDLLEKTLERREQGAFRTPAYLTPLLPYPIWVETLDDPFPRRPDPPFEENHFQYEPLPDTGLPNIAGNARIK